MRTLAKVAAIVLVGLAAACSDGKDPNEPLGIAGTYALQSVNGGALPIVLFEASDYKLEITAASYTLASGNTFTNSATFRETEGGVATTSTETFTGQYSVSGSTVTFTDSDGDVVAGTISGSTLTFSEDGVTAVFVKQP